MSDDKSLTDIQSELDGIRKEAEAVIEKLQQLVVIVNKLGAAKTTTETNGCQIAGCTCNTQKH